MTEKYSPWHLYRKPTPYVMPRGLEQELAIEFRSHDRDWERERGLATTIIQQNVGNLPYHDAFQRLFDLESRINTIHFRAKKDAISKTRADAKLNSVQSHMIARVAMEYALEIPDAYINRLDLQSASLSSTTNVDQIDNWYYPKIAQVAYETKAHRWIRGWIKRLSERVGPAVRGRGEEIRQDADEVWKQVIADRAYGIKNCFFESPLFHSDGHVFYVIDRSLGFGDPLQREFLPPDIEAVIGIGEKPAFGKSLQPQRTDIQIGKVVKYYRIDVGDVHTLNAVTTGGDIRTNVANLYSLREAFQAEGNEELFDLLRLFTFMRLYDLTARAVEVDKLPSIEQLEREIARNRTGLLRLGRKVKPFDYKTLLLPRVKPMVQEPEIIPSQTDTENSEKPQQFVDRHKVTWFVRRLPQGYHASETAKQYAQEHGVSLRDNETIVREHYRGKETGKPERPIKAAFRKKNQ